MTEPKLEDIRTIAAQYIADRDNYAKRYQDGNAGLFNSSASQLGFNKLLNQHAEALRAVLPPMNLVELEGLSELSTVLLNAVRSALWKG